MKNDMENGLDAGSRHLVISAVGEDRPGIVDALSRLIYDCGCNIADSRMSVLGGEFALILLVSGGAEGIGSLQRTLPDLESRLGLTLISRETTARTPHPGQRPYVVRAVAIDHPGIVHRLASFFSSRNINIEDLGTDSYAAPHTGAPMFALTMQVNVPAEMRVAELREQFLQFCDELNIDATMEPAPTPL